jgi:succinate dehydrogenase / fumarate reductase, cytochrome b subunit
MSVGTKKYVPRPNQLGLKGWAYAGKYGFERYLYLLHRVTGIGLVVYLLIHIIETGQRMAGPETWTALMALFSSPFFKMMEYALFAAFIFHGLNGVRLLVTELGFFLGKPAQPVYPYTSSMKRQRPMTYAVMALAALVIIVGASSLFLH